MFTCQRTAQIRNRLRILVNCHSLVVVITFSDLGGEIVPVFCPASSPVGRIYIQLAEYDAGHWARQNLIRLFLCRQAPAPLIPQSLTYSPSDCSPLGCP